MLILTIEVDAPDDANPIGVKEMVAAAVEHLGTVRVAEVRTVLPRQTTFGGFQHDKR